MDWVIKNLTMGVFKGGVVSFLCILVCIAAVSNIKKARKALVATRGLYEVSLVLLPQTSTYISLILLNAFASTWLSNELVLCKIMKDSIVYLTISPITAIIVSFCVVGFESLKWVPFLYSISNTKVHKCNFVGWMLSIVLTAFYCITASSMVETMIAMVNSFSEPVMLTIIYGICCVMLCLYSLTANREIRVDDTERR